MILVNTGKFKSEMLLWFGDDRPEYLQAVYELETKKADLIKMKVDLDRILNKRKLAEADINLLISTIEYLRKYAKIVTIREFQKMRWELIGANEQLINATRSIPIVQKQIKLVEDELNKMEGRLPSLKSKVLEFKRRD